MSYLTAAETRARLGLTQRELAARIGCSERTIRRIERGECSPSPMFLLQLRGVARHGGLTRRSQGPQPIREYIQAKMDYYLGKPGPRWLKMSGQQRAAFYAHRARYAKIRKELESGRAYGQPVVALLDSAPDLDDDSSPRE